MYDLKIINGKVLDFDTGEEYITDIGIHGGLITCVGSCPESAKTVIDASGCVVSPGFIDIHMHEEEINNMTKPYDISNSMLLMGVTTCVAGNCGNNRQSFDEFKRFVNKHGSPVNYLSFIGHNFLRTAVGSVDRYRKSTNLQIEKMQRLLVSAVEQGALGLSLGLEYCPGIDVDEILDLCASLQGRKILLSAHYRKDARYSISSLQELIDISKLSGFPMQISHIGSCSAFGTMKESLSLVEKALTQGLDISADCYPYDAFSTFLGSAVFDPGCFELWNKSYDSIMLTEAPYVGVRCDEELFYRVRQEHPGMLVVAFVMNEMEVVEALKAPFVIVASDGLFRNGQGHPRGAGTFPRVLGRYVRQQRELSLLDALKKMTIMPARRLGLVNKGEIKAGYDADLVVFRADEVMDLADFEHPKALPKGIEYVILGGKIAVKSNKIISGKRGKFIAAKV